ncbi:polysaccharide deacetylase family protein [Mesorhizobium sp. ZMM04-5]|uniref:Chitooligosaccharide deacetylase n=1 Tax=Mesorhizobium marinum TaxID=3228790 RepID=A0ABV3R1A0_9HYPH
MPLIQSTKRLVKHAAIRAGLEAVALSGAAALFPEAGGRGVIFTLHHVRPEGAVSEFSPNALLSVTPQFLGEAIDAALDCGLVPVHLHDLPALLSDPADERNFVAFTLDDGYRNNAEHAAPVFRARDVPYTIFINPGFVERTRTMWWETAAELTRRAPSFRFDFGDGAGAVVSTSPGQKYAAFDRLAAFVASADEDEAVARIDDVARDHGIDPIGIVDRLVMDEADLQDLARDPLVHFGAHTVTHVNLRRVPPERLLREIRESTTTVERYVGQRPRSFSYPYGWRGAVGEREVQAAADAGFPAAVTTQPGVLSAAAAARPTALPRVSLNGHFQKRRYVKALISGIPFRLM